MGSVERRNPPGELSLQPEAAGAVVEATKRPKPLVKRLLKKGSQRARQAVMRMNTEHIPKQFDANADPGLRWGKLPLSVKRAKRATRRFAGVVVTACLAKGDLWQHGKSRMVDRGVPGQPAAREGEAGLWGMAERSVVPKKPGNAGGGKGPQFKVNARRSEG